MSDLTYADHPRTIWYPANPKTGQPAGDPVTRNSSGAPRPRLSTPLSTFTVHYIGAGRTWLDSGDTAQELAGIETHHAIPTNKPNEYNSASDSDDETWGYAGPFQAAHTSGANSWAWGHLVVHGLEQPTEAQAQRLIGGIRRMRRQLVDAGHLTPNHAVKGHREMPKAETSCPGPLFENRAWWAQIVAPLVLPTPTPDPEEPDMVRFCKVNAKDTALFVRTSPTTVEHVRHPADLDRWINSGLVSNDLNSIDNIKPLLGVLTLVGPAPFYDLEDKTPTNLRTRPEMFRRQIA